MRIPVSMLFALALLAGCREEFRGTPGNGIAKSENRDVAKFDQVELDGIGRLEITIGSRGPLTLTGDENLLPLVHTQVSNSKLSIRSEKSIRPKLDLVFKVATTDIKAVETNGATSLVISGVKNDQLKTRVNGVGDVKLSGSTRKLELTVAGAGSADAQSLEAEDVKAELAGVGSAVVNAKRHLKASVAGVGSIQYVGNPTIEKTVGGLGTVKKKG